MKGRPLGLFALWLAEDHHDTREEHFLSSYKLCIPDKQRDRLVARRSLFDCLEVATRLELFRCERAKDHLEESEPEG